MLLLLLAEVYTTIGLLFAVVFLMAGIKHVDPASTGSSVGFRLIILPGVVVLWPMLLTRWIRGKGHAA